MKPKTAPSPYPQKPSNARSPVLPDVSFESNHRGACSPPYLGETDVGRLLSKALTANVQAVLADETGLVGADAAADLSVLTFSNHISSLLGVLSPS